MGNIDRRIKRISKEDIPLKEKVMSMLDYINAISRYSYSNREKGQEVFWNWLKTINIRDEVFLEEL